jgi:DNA-binding MarR family transcriptional regulator
MNGSPADQIGRDLVPLATLLPRLVVRKIERKLSLTEATLLHELSGQPRRITELAELAGYAQPTVTLLVKRLERFGLAERVRDADDRRVVLVGLTSRGRGALEEFQAQCAAVLGESVADLSDAELAALSAATEALGFLVERLQRGD